MFRFPYPKDYTATTDSMVEIMAEVTKEFATGNFHPSLGDRQGRLEDIYTKPDGSKYMQANFTRAYEDRKDDGLHWFITCHLELDAPDYDDVESRWSFHMWFSEPVAFAGT